MGAEQYEQARQLGEETLARSRRTLGEDHFHTLFVAIILAAALRGLGQHEQAHQLAQDTLTRMRRILGDNLRFPSYRGDIAF